MRLRLNDCDDTETNTDLILMLQRLGCINPLPIDESTICAFEITDCYRIVGLIIINFCVKSRGGMDPKTLKVFLGSLLAYTGLFIWMLRLRLRLLNLEGMQEPEFVVREKMDLEGEKQ